MLHTLHTCLAITTPTTSLVKVPLRFDSSAWTATGVLWWLKIQSVQSRTSCDALFVWTRCVFMSSRLCSRYMVPLTQQKAKYPNAPLKKFAARGVSTRPKQLNSNDCSVIMMYFVKRANEAILSNPYLLRLLDIESICTVHTFTPNIVHNQVLEFIGNAGL